MYSRTVESSVNSKPERVECMAVSPLNAFVYFFKSYSLDGAYRIREIFVYNGFADSDSFKYLRRLVRLEGGYAHF